MNGLDMRGFRDQMKVSVSEPSRAPWAAMFSENRSHGLKPEQIFSLPGDLYDLPRVPGFQGLKFPYSYGVGKINNTNSNSNSFRHQLGVSEIICERMGLYGVGAGGGGSRLVLDGVRGELVNAAKMMTPKELMEAKAVAASKSHSEAERRRRERINSHLAKLRTLLPSTTKTDKASLLAEVIDHVKDLKRRASEIANGSPVPTDVDELRVEEADGDEDNSEGRFVIKASLCCDDRPDLLADLNRTLHSLRLRAVKAEISTLGGRMKNVFIMTSKEEVPEKDQDSLSVSCVQEALRAVMERAASNELSSGSLASNKRQRIIPLDATSSAI